MNCEEARKRLGDSFDSGTEPGRDTEAHSAGCAACGAYAERLAALDSALGGLPLEVHSPELVARIRAHVAGGSPVDDSAYSVWRPAVVATVSCVVGFCILEWFYSFGARAVDWLGGAQGWLPALNPDQAGAYLVSLAGASWGECVSLIGPLAASVRPMVIWATLGAAVALLVLFDGFEAVRMRWSSDGGYPRQSGGNGMTTGQ